MPYLTMPYLPLPSSPVQLLAILASCILGLYAGWIACTYVTGRRKVIEDAFVEIAGELEALGKVPDKTDRKMGWLRSWWKSACEAAGSGWLSERELAAMRSCADALALRDDFGATWVADKVGEGLGFPGACGSCMALGMGLGALEADRLWIAGFAGVFVVALVGIVESDLRWRTIPTDLCALLLAGGICYQLCLGGVSWCLQGFVGGAVFAGSMLIMRALAPWFGMRESVGKGDVRLSACGLVWSGPCAWLALATVAVVAGVHFVTLKVTGKGNGKTMMPLGPTLCFGIFVGALACLVL